jgi:hypothetical protein
MKVWCKNCVRIGNVNDLISQLQDLRELLETGDMETASAWIAAAVKRLEGSGTQEER